MKADTRRHKCDFWILILTFALLAMGLVLLFVVGSMYTGAQEVGDNQYFVKQFWISLFAIVCFVVAYKVPYKFFQNLVKIIAAVALLFAVLLLIAKWAGWGIASCGGGQCRWLDFGFFSFQPSELMKLALILYLANFLNHKKRSNEIGAKNFWLQIVMISALYLGLVMIAQGDLGTGIIMALIIFGMLYTAGISRKSVFLIIGLAVVGIILLAVFEGYRMARISTWLEIWQAGDNLVINDGNRQAVNALIALGSGGMFGVGIGNSIQSTGWLSESVNDSIFAIIGETFGFLGTLVVVVMFAVLFWRILRVANRTIDFEDRTIVIGVFMWLTSQTVLNITSMTALTPMTGITLPLISYGGTSIVSVMIGIALVSQFSCYTSKEGIKNENISRGRGVRGSHYASRRRGA